MSKKSGAFPASLQSRPPYERMQKVHQALVAEKFPNAKSLAKALEVSAKTIQRDLDFMRDRLQLPIGYDDSRRGFFYTEAVSGFPTVQITEGELVALLVAGEAIQAFQGTPYQRPLAAAFEKLTAAMTDAVSFVPEDLPASISFRGMGRVVVDAALFQAASKAVLDCEEIAFDYQKLHAAGPEARRVQPYHFAAVNGLWYLVGHDLDRQAMRTFALPRIRKLVRAGRHFRRDPGFTARRYFGDSLGVLRGDETVVVRIAFDAYAAAFVRERVWHESQAITEKPGGEIELEMRLSFPEEAMRWALSWGEHARVLAPAEMVERVRETVKRMGAAYGG